MAEKDKSIANFTLNIKQNQNATMQGQIEWLEGGKRTNFRSEWEFLQLMGEVIGDEPAEWN